jgi:hypothetical protein
VYVSNLDPSRQRVRVQLDFGPWDIHTFQVTDTESGRAIGSDGKAVVLDVAGHDFRSLLVEQPR